MNGDINMTAKRGYTLIEILIVITLFSIILLIALPNMGFYRLILEKQEIAEFKKDLLYARNMAIVENESYIVYFFKHNNSYSIKTSETNITIKSKTFGNGLKLDNIDIVGSFIFNPSGAAGNSNSIYINTSRDKVYEVRLSPVTSRVEIVLE